MKNKFQKALCLVLLLTSQINFGQTKTDSIRIVKEAMQLIHLPEPKFDGPLIMNPSQKDIDDLGFEQPNQSEPIVFDMEDGIKITGQKYSLVSEKTVILLHGVLASSYTYNKMSGLLRKTLKAEVISLDLRGHGQSGGTLGDISKANQYAEDLDTVIKAVKLKRPNQKIILAGHSMGGGIVLKHSETFPETKIEAYILFAPNLGIQSPTTSQKMDLKNNFIKTHLSRGLGLKMLNEYRIHTHDSLKVAFYNLPEQSPVKSYSYRSMEASYPNNYKKTLQDINAPLIVLVGRKDEAFIAEEYPIVIQSYSKGDCFIIKDETHNGIRHNTMAMDKISKWMNKNRL